MKSKPSTELIERSVTNAPKIKLELLSGPLDGLIFELADKETTIGRDPSCDIQLQLDNLISRKHATIRRENGNYWIEDLGSRNGTFIKEQAIKGKTQLSLETVFRIGATEMRLLKQ